MCDQQINKSIIRLLCELNLDKTAIKIYSKMPTNIELTVRELSYEIDMPVSKIYRAIKILDNYHLIDKQDKRPIKIYKKINTKVLNSLAKRAERKILLEMETRLLAIKPLLRNEQNPIATRKISKESFISIQEMSDSQNIVLRSNIDSVKKITEKFFSQKNLSIIFPFETLNFLMPENIKEIIKDVIDEHSNIKIETLNILLTGSAIMKDFSEILPFFDYALLSLIERANKTRLRFLKGITFYPIVLSKNINIFPIMTPNFNEIFGFILLQSEEISLKLKKQFRDFWAKSDFYDEFSKEKFELFINSS
ncbi:MAG: helix-turn-helix domain-containing protein [Asgard group archaeon]|nr:helix-turn-helix domain-containing protein [Asgard group archaeon]